MSEPNDLKSFRALFCSHFGCPEADYETVALHKMIHRRWLPVAAVIMKMKPSFFRTDLQIIRQLGLVTSRANLLAEVQDLRSDYGRRKDFGFVRRRLRLRLSGERILRLAGILLRSK